MIKKFLALFMAMILAVAAYAVDVNTADQAALETVKGIGPATAHNIVTERDANGPFKSFADLAARIKGLGDKKVMKLKANGLTIGAGETKADMKKHKMKD